MCRILAVVALADRRGRSIDFTRGPKRLSRQIEIPRRRRSKLDRPAIEANTGAITCIAAAIAATAERMRQVDHETGIASRRPLRNLAGFEQDNVSVRIQLAQSPCRRQAGKTCTDDEIITFDLLLERGIRSACRQDSEPAALTEIGGLAIDS